MNESNLTKQTFDIVADNVKRLTQLFPEIVTDDKIDFEKLQAILGEYIETDNERYNFTWHGKSRALRLAQTPSTGTLRPSREESKDWDTTQNLYIEGDNLEVLKLLQKSYHNKIKMIYIDPPYNTGNDFVYSDDYKDNLENYLRMTGQKNENGDRISTKSEKSGRYHTNWLNMMYPRLRLAKNLLTYDGVIFISIDDNEVYNLRKLCDEVFGEENFVANVVWQKKYAATNDSKGFSVTHDYILVYQRSSSFNRNLLPRTVQQNAPYRNDDDDGKGLWRSDNLLVKSFSSSGVYPIINPNTGKEYFPPDGSCWRASKDTMEKWLEENRIYFGKDGLGAPQLKRYLNEVQQGRVPITWWTFEEVGHNDAANKELSALFEAKTPFDTPKPSTLIKQMLLIATNSEDIILDFFAGSSTTAHAVMQLNAEDSGKRTFIMVQIPEPCGENTEAVKAGYKNISEIGKERIRRAGERMVKSEELKVNSGELNFEGEEGEHAALKSSVLTVKSIERSSLDVGFKVLKLDSSNLKKWNPDYDYLEASLEGMVSNYVDGRSELDVVYEIMLKYGINLTFLVEEYDFKGKKVYSIGYGALLICLDDDITTGLAHDIIKLKTELTPETMRVVFKDNGFKDDAAKTNVKENLRQAGIDEFVTV